MAQNSSEFIKSLCTVIEALYDLGIPFQSVARSNEEDGDANNYICLTVDHFDGDIYITIESNGRVLLTFKSDKTGFSIEPQILTSRKPYKRITYGKNTISNIKDDLKNI